MNLKPVDIQHREFKKTFRGYNHEEVDDFLDQIYDNYSEIYKENMFLKEQIDLLAGKMQHYKVMEENLQGALLIAQKTADETIANAHKQADIILREARMQSEKLIEEAKNRVREILEEQLHLERQRERFSMEFKSLLELYLSMLNNGNAHLNQSKKNNPNNGEYKIIQVLDEGGK